LRGAELGAHEPLLARGGLEAAVAVPVDDRASEGRRRGRRRAGGQRGEARREARSDQSA
jgi:hypothetical protein